MKLILFFTLTFSSYFGFQETSRKHLEIKTGKEKKEVFKTETKSSKLESETDREKKTTNTIKAKRRKITGDRSFIDDSKIKK
jgi:hypothetical protein